MITVIGLGPMGQAMAQTYVKAGHPTTVWSRTIRPVEGVTVAPSVKEALAANELVILSLTDYQAMYDILDGQDITGKVLVNLSSDTLTRTRQAADWATERGATFITGGIMVPSPLVGSDVSYVFYSGPKDVLDKHEPVLKLIGRVDYVGADPGLAQLFYQAQLGVFLTSLSAYLHATALLKAEGVSADKFVPYAADNFNSIAMYLDHAAEQIEKGEHPGDQANVLMMGATADHVATISEESGVDVELPRAVKSHYDRAIAAGYGRASWTSLYEVLKAK